MAITNLKVSNFKSFKDLDLNLGRFNVLVGANASGKSNFTQIFKFVRDIVTEGLDYAVSMQGLEYLANVAATRPKVVSVEVTSDYTGGGLLVAKSVWAQTTELTSHFELSLDGNGAGYKVTEDRITVAFDVVEGPGGKTRTRKKAGKLGRGTIEVSKHGQRMKQRVCIGRRELPNRDINPYLFFAPGKHPTKAMLIEGPYPQALMRTAYGLYDFDPKLAKQAAVVRRKFELEENGQNLSVVLKSILGDPEKKRKFSNLIRDLLPFVEDLKTDRLADGALMFRLSESYQEEKYFPASLISDGTVNAIASVIALYFENKDLVVLEEPERNIHPHLISGLVEMMKDAARNKQIIVTTHSPEIVRHAGVENLLLISRDKDGFSTVSRPAEKRDVQIFLENDLGLDEVFIQELWGM
jgi:energy-coupling factor transporter ATP-binding protein EcfA2